MSILCYESHGSENYFRTKAASDLEAEQSLAPKSKSFPWFLEVLMAGAEVMKCNGNFQLAGWARVLQSLGVTDSTLTVDALTQYKHEASPCSLHKCTTGSSEEEGDSYSSAIAC